MKRILSLILCAALLALLPMQALAATGDMIVARTEDGPMRYGLESFCGAGDALYFTFNSGTSENDRTLGVHRAGEAEMQQYSLTLGDAPEANGYEDIRLLSDSERVFALREVSSYEDDSQSVYAELYQISIHGESAEATLISTPDWSIFRSENGYYNYIENLCCAGNFIVATYYDDTGTANCVRMALDGDSFGPCAIEGEIVRVTAYTEGRLLIQQYADENYTRLRFICYDPATDENELLCEVETEQYSLYEGLACDSESGAAYYKKQGEICELDLQTGESGEAITDMPESMYSNTVSVVLRGGYYACASYDCYIFRNLHPDTRPDTRIKIYDGSYYDNVTQACYAFANAHGDVSTILSRDYNSQNSLVEDMMNRSGDIDVYIISADSADYQAIFDRGYMAELGDSEKLRAVAERMYPAMREALSIDGELCALPVNCFFWLPFANRESMNQIGLTMEDVPTSWDDFLDFLMELAEKLPEDGSISLFDSYMSDVESRRSIFDRIFAGYQQLLQIQPDAVSTEQMAALLQKLEMVDFQALGQPSQEEMQSEEFFYDDAATYCLFEMNMGTSIENITSMQPMVMSLTADTPQMLVVSTIVAFINPFSENRELALEFMETLAEKQPDIVEYVIYADMTEPLENKYYQDSLKDMQSSIDKLRAQYESAEEADKQALKEALDSAEANLADYEKYRYSITESDIAWIRQYADALVLQGNNWLYSDNSGDAYQLVQQYCEGQIDARKLMDEIGRKIRMMMMEGY